MFRARHYSAFITSLMIYEQPVCNFHILSPFRSTLIKPKIIKGAEANTNNLWI
jgi:hypothetical protein